MNSYDFSTKNVITSRRRDNVSRLRPFVMLKRIVIYIYNIDNMNKYKNSEIYGSIP